MAKNLILWLVIAVVLMSVFQSFTPGSSNEQQVDYTRFIQDVRQGQIREATLIEMALLMVLKVAVKTSLLSSLVATIVI